MKYHGTMSHTDMDWNETDIRIREAVLTKNSLTLDWEEDGELCMLKATSADGFEYSGHFGSPRPERTNSASIRRYAGGGMVILLMRLIQEEYGNEHVMFVELFPD